MAQVAIITASDSGIGKECALLLAQQGFDIGITWHSDEEGAKDTAREVVSHGVRAEIVQLDLGNLPEGALALEKLIQRLGRIDVLVNNACISRRGILSGCSYEDFNEVLRVGVSAPYLLSSLFLEHFPRGASIVNIASSRAFMSQKDTESYSAAKGGIIALTHALAMSLAPRGVRVNSISPGWIDTGKFGTLTREDARQHPGADGVERAQLHLALFQAVEAGNALLQRLVAVEHRPDGRIQRGTVAGHGHAVLPAIK